MVICPVPQWETVNLDNVTTVGSGEIFDLEIAAEHAEIVRGEGLPELTVRVVRVLVADGHVISGELGRGEHETRGDGEIPGVGVWQRIQELDVHVGVLADVELAEDRAIVRVCLVFTQLGVSGLAYLEVEHVGAGPAGQGEGCGGQPCPRQLLGGDVGQLLVGGGRVQGVVPHLVKLLLAQRGDEVSVWEVGE